MLRPRKRPRGPSSSSSTTTYTDDYDVFLNHRGPDVKGGFIAHLDDALRSVGVNPFLDKRSLKKGDYAFTSIDAALDVARIHVAVVSRRYAESKHCLNELVAMITSGKPVIPVFYDVEPAHLRKVENGPFATAFENHKSKESMEQVHEWADALQKLADINGYRLCDYKGDEAELKWEVVNAIHKLLPTNEAMQLEQYFVGLKEQVNSCIHKLENMSGAMNFLCLVGMGGIGKTTLAKEIYNYFFGLERFQAMSILEVDRNTPSSIEVGSSLFRKLQKKLLWDLLQVTDNNQQSYQYWFTKLRNQGPVLIVLDDIKNKHQFEMLIFNKNLLAPGSCIIVTSRDRQLLKGIAKESDFYLHEVRLLGYNDSKKLFNWHAFGNEEAPDNFKALANDVSKACGGLPLALKVVGSSLFGKKSDDDLKFLWPEAIDALKEDPDVMNALRWSYDCLSEPEKLMFVDIACVFYGWKKQEALEIWKSCKECSSCCGSISPYISLEHLIDKSLVVLEEHPTSVSEDNILIMHCLLRDMGQSMGKVNESHLWGGRAEKAIDGINHDSNKVRALNLANSRKKKFDAQDFSKMPNLHFLKLDGCHVSGNLGIISEELRWLQWKSMPLIHLPPMLNLFNLMSLDFSQSTELATIWTESNPALEACPNLLRLNLNDCTSIKTLPDSIGHLSKLQVLELHRCKNLQKLPSSIGQLIGLQRLLLEWCASLEALPDTITALSQLELLDINFCSKLPSTFGLMTSLTSLYIDLATKWQVLYVGQLDALKELGISICTNEVITMLDSSKILQNLKQLSEIWFYECPLIIKLPESIGLLSNLSSLDLWRCEKLQELPASIRQFKLLTRLSLRYLSKLEIVPDSLGTFTSLKELWIVECTSITDLPMSMGHLSSLWRLHIQGCTKLQSLPNSLKQLNALEIFQILDCGSCLEGLEALRVLQGLHIWGCTTITELSGSCLYAVDGNSLNPNWFYNFEPWDWVRQNVKELRVVESNDCGFLRYVQVTQTRRVILQRVHKLPCCKVTDLATHALEA